MGDRARYEKKTVKAMRGTERMVVAKWEKRGWEFIDRTPGAVHTDLAFRRSKPRVTRQSLALFGLIIALIGVITIGALTERDDPKKKTESADASQLGIDNDTTATIQDFLAALRRGDLQEYAQGHNGDPIEFEARVIGVGPGGLKTAAFINLRAVPDGNEEGPLLKLIWGGPSQIPFPSTLQGGDRVRVRANIDRYFSDEEVWLSPDDDNSFIREQ